MMEVANLDEEYDPTQNEPHLVLRKIKFVEKNKTI
jgi:hypothetical protein